MAGLRPWYKDEKQVVAVSSVGAAVFLTTLKLYASYKTGSLGILSEFLHSALDLIAAIITVWAVRTAAFPADREHAYGHGKIESFSALAETMLLLGTCIWIMYEAVMRIVHPPHLYANELGITVMATAIVIDLSRWRGLSKVAKKYDSQALEADALHFSSDVLSSSVVIVGLVFVKLGYPLGDPLAAMGVAMVVLFLCYRLGKKTYDSLVDVRLPPEDEKIIRAVLEMHKGEFVEFHDFRTRHAGAEHHVDMHLVTFREQTVDEAHAVTEEIEREITARLKNAHVLIHIEPCGGACVNCEMREPCPSASLETKP